MSSKVFPPGEELPVSPLVWRNVDAAILSQTAGQTAVQPAPDPAAQIEQLEQQYQQKVRDARAAGVHEGEIAGRNRAAAEVHTVVERLGRSIQEIANLRARLRREAEADVVQLALAIARRVFHRELAADPDALRGLVVAALEKLQGQDISRVKVHPSQAAMMKSCLQQAVSGGLVEVQSDSSCEVGAIVFETTRGNLDASVDSQLQEIERGLTDRLRKQP
jgi:flagellar assembly protein FliH